MFIVFRFAFLAAVFDLMDQKHLYQNPFSFTKACFWFLVCLFILLDKIPLLGRVLLSWILSTWTLALLGLCLWNPYCLILWTHCDVCADTVAGCCVPRLGIYFFVHMASKPISKSFPFCLAEGTLWWTPAPSRFLKFLLIYANSPFDEGSHSQLSAAYRWSKNPPSQGPSLLLLRQLPPCSLERSQE